MNGYSYKEQVLPKLSTQLCREEDLGGGVDIIVTEISYDDLINEGALATFEHASSLFRSGGAKTIPAWLSPIAICSLRIYAMLVV